LFFQFLLAGLKAMVPLAALLPAEAGGVADRRLRSPGAAGNQGWQDSPDPGIADRIAVTASSLAVSTISERLPVSAKAFNASAEMRPLAIETRSVDLSRGP
jgi:hypothetical protein